MIEEDESGILKKISKAFTLSMLLIIGEIIDLYFNQCATWSMSPSDTYLQACQATLWAIKVSVMVLSLEDVSAIKKKMYQVTGGLKRI